MELQQFTQIVYRTLTALSGYFNSFETNGIEIDRNSDINGLNDRLLFAIHSGKHPKFFDVVTWTGTNGN